MPPIPKKPKPSTARLPSSPQKSVPSIYLAHRPGAQGDNLLMGVRGVDRIQDDSKPALLISYWYLDKFLEHQARYAYRDWVLDSGAFSAMNSGAEIDLEDYTNTCTQLLSADPTLSEVFALDVIGDWRASARNTEYMWKKGVPAIPTFHYGGPWDVLKGLAKDYPKIGIGGCVGKRDKEQFAAQCFARVWPCRMHGFNFASEKSVMGHPWHSVDSSDWELKPVKFGHWRAFGSNGGTAYMNWGGSNQNLKAEVMYYLRLEERAREKWKTEMAVLETLSDPKAGAPTVRLAMTDDGTGSKNNRYKCFGPTVRLVAARDGGAQQRLDRVFSPEEGDE